MKTLKDAEFQGKTVLIRVDYNVPLDEEKNVTDNLRIVSTIPTVDYILECGAKVVLCSHLGRPDGQPKPEFSLRPVAEEAARVFEEEVVFADDDEVVGEKTLAMLEQFKKSDARIMLLQNTRYRAEEEANDPEFSKQLASLADVFVMDAFGAAHRAHASTVGVADYLPTYAGLLMADEVKYLGELLEEPHRPFTVVMGGSKVSDKIQVFRNLLKKADSIIVGGAMAYTFLKAQGYNVGISKVEADKLDLANEILELAKEKGVEFYLPTDCSGSTEFSNDTPKVSYAYNEMPDDFMGLDIGPETQAKYKEVLKNSKTIVLNGPMGVFEMENYTDGTIAVLEGMALAKDAVKIVGGGDSAAAVSQFGYTDDMTHISTGGGASLKLMEGKLLPGVKVCL
ncbi:MAG: phosphoglycerate kinase [Eubacteriaceae bacterium]|nr:phosphoglycerate kinase [Eubacteriaceae bacterium]